jgi:two-component sensor histidine kinase/CheY-like chemotaxis protein
VPDGQASAAGWRVVGTILDITERKQAEERQRLLMAELDHRVKNILSNVSAVAHLSSHRAPSVGSFVAALDGRIQAMSQAHSLLARRAWAGADLRELLTEVLAPFLSSAKDNIRIEGNLAWVSPELTQSLALTLHELATNALKHGALSVPTGHVAVSWTIDPTASPSSFRLLWQERDGPPVIEPTMRGFGLTVLQAAASGVGARAECRFDKEGFVYSLEGPFAVRQGPQAAASAQQRPARPAQAVAANAEQCQRSRVLVVEDEALLALQLKADLESAGHQVVGPARSLQAGISLAKETKIDVALVDVSLGCETSTPLADQLLAKNVPFAFVTGYSDTAILPEHLRTMPRLTKPYALADVERLLADLLQGR